MIHTLLFAAALALPPSTPAPAAPAPGAHAALAPATLPGRTWVFFTDKGFVSPEAQSAAIAQLAQTYNPRAIQRRQLRRTDPGLFDARDLPVAQRYLDAVTATGAQVHVTAGWLNAASVVATPEQLDAIRRLSFVASTRPVARGRRGNVNLNHEDPVPPETRGGFYGITQSQLQQMNLIALHQQGFTAQNVIIGILDTGFRRTHVAFNTPGHVLQVVAEHDFVNNDGNTAPEPGDDPDQHRHGTWILSTLGAYAPNEYVGGAYNASFVLCKTEDITSETPIEEDNYAGGLQFIEAHGGDMATSSLGYIDWYTQADLNGHTAVTTIAVNAATANGVYCCTAAGNEGHDGNPSTSHLIAPADALRVLTCGAVDSGNSTAGFSSDGPTADGRLKPEVLARGVNTDVISSVADTGYGQVSGTSLSTPMVACTVACLASARPYWTVDQMRSYLFATASDFVANGVPDATFVRGYGVVNAASALAHECRTDMNGDLSVNVQDYLAFLQLYSTGNPRADFNGDGLVNVGDFLNFLAAYAGGC